VRGPHGELLRGGGEYEGMRGELGGAGDRNGDSLLLGIIYNIIKQNIIN